MEWSLTQNKLLAFHRLMRTDVAWRVTAALANIMGVVGGDTGRSPALDPGGVCRGCLADARCRMCGE